MDVGPTSAQAPEPGGRRRAAPRARAVVCGSGRRKRPRGEQVGGDPRTAGGHRPAGQARAHGGRGGRVRRPRRRAGPRRAEPPRSWPCPSRPPSGRSWRSPPDRWGPGRREHHSGGAPGPGAHRDPPRPGRRFEARQASSGVVARGGGRRSSTRRERCPGQQHAGGCPALLWYAAVSSRRQHGHPRGPALDRAQGPGASDGGGVNLGKAGAQGRDLASAPWPPPASSGGLVAEAPGDPRCRAPHPRRGTRSRNAGRTPSCRVARPTGRCAGRRRARRGSCRLAQPIDGLPVVDQRNSPAHPCSVMKSSTCFLRPADDRVEPWTISPPVRPNSTDLGLAGGCWSRPGRNPRVIPGGP